MFKFIKTPIFYRFIFCLGVAALLMLPTQNSTLDAYAYASQIKYGQDLYLPHHLLYNAFLRFLITISPFSSDVLAFCKVINTLFLILSLGILKAILSGQKIEKSQQCLCLCLVLFSFSSLRYASENENYILPIFFSLLGTYYYFQFSLYRGLKSLFFSGFWLCIACLFHQIHFFWWLGILMGIAIYYRSFKHLFWFSISSFIVPLAYVLVLVFCTTQPLSLEHFIRFVLHDFYHGTATTKFGLMNFEMTAISCFRSFLQVHGSVLLLLKSCVFYFIPLVLSAIFGWVFIKNLLTSSVFSTKNTPWKAFDKSIILVAVLHLAFAFYAVGNAEFLVMLPFLIILVFAKKINSSIFGPLLGLLIIWNLSFGLFPNYYYRYYNEQKLAELVLKNPRAIFIISDHTLLHLYQYQTGEFEPKNIILLKNATEKQIVFYLKNGKKVYTDAINRPIVINRSLLLKTKPNADIFKAFKTKKLEKISAFYGDYHWWSLAIK